MEYISIIIKTNKGSVLIILLAVVVMVGFGMWYVATQRVTIPSEATPTPTSTVTPTETTIDTSDWKTYSNEELGVSFKYPAEMEIIQTTPELKMMLSGPEQFDSPGFLDGLFLIIGKTSIERGKSLKQEIYDDLSVLYSVDINDFREIIVQDKPAIDVFPEFVGKDVSLNRQISIEVSETEAITFSLSIGRNYRFYYNSIRNSIIDSIEFVE